MPRRNTEPRRAPKVPATSVSERVGAGCLGLFVLPWFLVLMFSTYVTSVGLPLEGLGGVIGGMFSLAVFVPMLIVLGSVSITALSRALGSNEPIRVTHRASAGIGVSAIVLFVLASIAGAFTAGGFMPLLTVAAIVATLAAITSFARRHTKRRAPQRERRKHQKPPPAPWEHPLARTEEANLYAEALVDEYNVVTVLAATAISILVGNPIPLLTAGGLELIYLAFVPDTEWFRRRVERKHLEMAHEQAAERRDEQKKYLASDQLERHEKLVKAVARAKQTLERGSFGFDEQRLDQVIDHHLWLMQLENYYTDLDVAGRLRDLDRQLDAARSDADGVTGRMSQVLQTRVDVLERRHAQLERMADRAREVSDSRRVLEETIPLITESALAGEARLDDLDEILFELQVTEEVVLELHDEDDALEAEIEAAYAEATA